MRDAIVFDIDGTLSDCRHRLHHLPHDWNAFFEAMPNDPPNKDIFWLARLLGDKAYTNDTDDPLDFKILIFSSRPEKYRPETIRWLEDNWPTLNFSVGQMYMRPNGDMRDDRIVKKEMLEKARNRGYNIRLVIDDRQKVVDMWRSLGITCLQMEPHKANQPPTVKPGKLTLMVGPSCAGKSYYLYNVRFDYDTHICSDIIRERLCGDFKDQSKNKEVFNALHSIAKTRIEHGLDTIIDATNLKNADRKRFLDWAPPSCVIEYIVINRPMMDKEWCAEWRKDVMVKGKSLIQYHEDVFNSNLKDILAGDNDPRVTVIDERKF